MYTPKKGCFKCDNWFLWSQGSLLHRCDSQFSEALWLRPFRDAEVGGAVAVSGFKLKVPIQLKQTKRIQKGGLLWAEHLADAVKQIMVAWWPNGQLT